MTSETNQKNGHNSRPPHGGHRTSSNNSFIYASTNGRFEITPYIPRKPSMTNTSSNRIFTTASSTTMNSTTFAPLTPPAPSSTCHSLNAYTKPNTIYSFGSIQSTVKSNTTSMKLRTPSRVPLNLNQISSSNPTGWEEVSGMLV